MSRLLPWITAVGGLTIFSPITPAFAQTPEDEIQFAIMQLTPNIGYEVAALQYVLTREEMEQLLALRSTESKRKWIDEYWKGRDPVYTTVESETRIEHEQRVAFAEKEFRIPEWPGWDHRGIVHLRYGRPTQRRIIGADVSAASFAPPREIWYYADYEMTVMFEDVMSRGNFERIIYSGAGAGGGQRVFKVGQSIDGPLAKIGTGEVRLEDLEPMPDEWEHLIGLGKYDVMVTKMPSTYQAEFADSRLEAYFAIAHFRGGEGVDRVDVNMEFVADLSPGPSADKSRAYNATAVFWDKDNKEVGRDAHSVTLPTVNSGEDSLRMFPTQLKFSLPPDFYHMAVTVEDKSTGKFASYRHEVGCPDFDTELSISDIVFASKIAEVKGDSPFNRGPLMVVPHPFGRYDMSAAIPVYFEVYNLATGADELSRYTVEYQVRAKTPKKRGFWASLFGREPALTATSASFQASSRGAEDHIEIRISPSTLWVGEFDLKVTITDNRSGKVASGQSTFHIVEGEQTDT